MPFYRIGGGRGLRHGAGDRAFLRRRLSFESCHFRLFYGRRVLFVSRNGSGGRRSRSEDFSCGGYACRTMLFRRLYRNDRLFRKFAVFFVRRSKFVADIGAWLSFRFGEKLEMGFSIELCRRSRNDPSRCARWDQIAFRLPFGKRARRKVGGVRRDEYALFGGAYDERRGAPFEKRKEARFSFRRRTDFRLAAFYV